MLVVRWNTPGKALENLEKEIVAALAVCDLTHSKLKSSIPERGSRWFVDDKIFDKILDKVCIGSFWGMISSQFPAL